MNTLEIEKLSALDSFLKNLVKSRNESKEEEAKDREALNLALILSSMEDVTQVVNKNTKIIEENVIKQDNNTTTP